MVDQLARGTGTLAGARDHARHQEVPLEAEPDVPGALVWATTVHGGGYASRRLPRGAVLRIEDVDGDACVQLLVHSAHRPAERLNVADTVKVQWQAYLNTGAVLLSDMGRALMTVLADTSGHHDCFCGASTRAANAERYGDGSASGPAPSGRDLLALGVAKLGLERADVGPSINLFRGVRVGADGSLVLEQEHPRGAHVDLRAEVDVLVTLAVTPHPLDDRLDYTATPARCTAWIPDVVPEPDPLRTSTPERRRAFESTDELLRELR